MGIDPNGTKKSSKLCGIRATALKAIFISVGMAQAIG